MGASLEESISGRAPARAQLGSGAPGRHREGDRGRDRDHGKAARQAGRRLRCHEAGDSGAGAGRRGRPVRGQGAMSGARVTFSGSHPIRARAALSVGRQIDSGAGRCAQGATRFSFGSIPARASKSHSSRNRGTSRPTAGCAIRPTWGQRGVKPFSRQRACKVRAAAHVPAVACHIGNEAKGNRNPSRSPGPLAATSHSCMMTGALATASWPSVRASQVALRRSQAIQKQLTTGTTVHSGQPACPQGATDNLSFNLVPVRGIALLANRSSRPIFMEKKRDAHAGDFSRQGP